ncbi:hypothetical protein CLV42_11369 [Chitinophaga ginsengisoli]|uniref:Uncharacterized protein n=1 Tax=Chitinophaga ginsengisoli TaxID=363837 RepID=A0A2P8FUI9_9BACT|nr:hypothetical protein CLV42_11369 [Chitinophaga ginsengisoli]
MRGFVFMFKGSRRILRVIEHYQVIKLLLYVEVLKNVAL